MRPADGLESVVEPQAEVYVRKSETIDELAVDVVCVRVSAVGMEARKVAGGGGTSRADLEALVLICEADCRSAACRLVEALGENRARLSRGRATARGCLLLLAVAGRG